MSARRIPIRPAVHLLRAALLFGHTWRFRDPYDPSIPLNLSIGPRVYGLWHEHLLPLSWLCAGRGITPLASRGRDGEIAARILTKLGYVPARGSSSRGGSIGFRELSRALKAGRGVALTADGPRGPRRSMKEGVLHLALHTQRMIVPVGLSATVGRRLNTWDRFLIPAPGATVFVSFGTPIAPTKMTLQDLETALTAEVDQCEAAANEARRARTSQVVQIASNRERGDSSPACAAKTFERDTRSKRLAWRLEKMIRKSWTRKSPPILFRLLSLGFALLRDLRHAAYDSGLIHSTNGGLPVVSVGGVTVGGSGKTPLSSAISAFLNNEGHSTAILTRGYKDELSLHTRWLPNASVRGHPDRLRLARRASADGATVAILDDGFQHRRLARDVEILTVDRDALRRTNRWCLPAGPFRERWLSAIQRADIILITGREPWGKEVADFDEELRTQITKSASDKPTASITFETDAPIPANDAARSSNTEPLPRVALTGTMKPNLFFDLAETWNPSITTRIALPDHGMLRYGQDRILQQSAGDGGVVMTEKDFCRLENTLPSELKIWILPERLVWHSGQKSVWEHLRRVVPSPPEEPRSQTSI